jgi:hypothetical protein
VTDGREGGFIKLHRRLESWPLWQSMTALQRMVWIQILLSANWKDGEGWHGTRRYIIRRGQTSASEEEISRRARVSRRVVRDAFAKLLKEGAIGREKVPLEGQAPYLVTVRNYDKFQSTEEEEGPRSGQEGTKVGPSSGPDRALIEEGEEVKEGKKEAAAGPLPIGRLPSALPSPAEVDSARWPAIEQLAQHLANLRGLTACPLTWPRRENRDRLETAIARATVARSAQCALAVWSDAAKSGKLVSSLGFFVAAIEALGNPGPQEQPLSTCAVWDAVLQQVRKYSADAAERLAKATPRIAGGALVLSADAPLADAIRELYWSRLEPLVQSIHGLRLEVEQEKLCPTSLHSV